MAGTSSTLVRGDLVNLIEQELLGPRDGAQEEIVGTPRARYAVGALAPVTVDPERAELSTSSTIGNDAGDPGMTGEAISDVDKEHLLQEGVPVDTDEEAGTAVDDEERDEGPKGALTHPSSMGLRFQVPRDCGVLAVTASWGRYDPTLIRLVRIVVPVDGVECVVEVVG